MFADTFTPDTLVVANHSGGKDSQAMLIKLLEVVPREQLLVVHASLGAVEWPDAQAHAERQASDAGLPFLVAVATKTLFEMVAPTAPRCPAGPAPAPASAPRI